MQMYLDYTAPAIALGAVQRSSGSWLTRDKGVVTCIADYLDHHGVEPARVTPPKGRTFAAIRKAALAAASKHPPQPGMAVRAAQYCAAMHGEETPHSSTAWRGKPEKYCVFSKAPDGSKRVRLFRGWRIPHWDFVPKAEETTQHAK